MNGNEIATIPSADVAGFPAHEQQIVAQALSIMRQRVSDAGYTFIKNPEEAKTYLQLEMGGLDHEEFWCLWLGAQGEVLKLDKMFRGNNVKVDTPIGEIIKSGLKANAVAVVLAHNHPGGDNTPSDQDMQSAVASLNVLDLVDIRVLDAYVVSARGVVSVLAAAAEKKAAESVGLMDLLGMIETLTKGRSGKAKAERK